MPKKIKTKRTFKPSWKFILKIFLLFVTLLLIGAQLWFNKFIYDRTAENGSLKITLLIQNSLEQLEDIKSTPKEGPDKAQLIEQARLKLPPETDEVKRLLYFYTPADAGSDESGYSWNVPEAIQITTKQMASVARQRILTGQTVEDVFNLVPEAQACNRGFTVQFIESTDNGLNLSGTVSLKDGRMLYLYREPECKSITEIVDSLEAYLLKAVSY